MSLNLDIPDTPRLRDKLAAACLFLLVFIGIAAGYWIGATRVPVPEDISAAPAQRQSDGSLVLARQPDAKPPPAPHKTPAGGEEVRRITTTLQPKPGTTADGTPCTCRPISLTTSLVDIDGGLRVVQSAGGADVVDGVDAPIRPLLLAPPPRAWAAGVSFDPFAGSWGGWAERDIGRVRLGVDIYDDRNRPAARLRAGFNF